MQHIKLGTTLQRGKYRVEAVIGEGGFGNTYMATNCENGQRIAIKEFFWRGVTERDDMTGKISVSDISLYEVFKQQKEKFRKEAARLQQFNNPHIVRVYDQFEENGTAYYVMDFIDGESLSEKMKRTGLPLTEQEVRELLPQMLDALKCVHDAGLLHLDLKPGNLMVDKQGNVKLIDFGASKQLDTQRGGATAKTRQTYTNGYAPREQMDENFSKYGPWTDIYALGATLYCLLTKRRPPMPLDIDDDETDDKHIALPFPDSVSDGMHNLVLYMMKQNRTERPQSVDVLMQTFNSDSSSKQRQQESENPRQQAEPNDNTRTQNSEETMFKAGADNEKTQHSTQSHNETSRRSAQSASEETAYSSKQTSKSSNKPSYEPVYDEDETDQSASRVIGIMAVFIFCAFIVGALLSNVHQCSSSQAENAIQTETSTSNLTTEITSDDATYGKKDVTYPNMGTGVYEGGLQNGEPHGHGTINYSSGMTFIGDFQNGQTHGHGVLKSATGTVLFDGTYENGKRKEGKTTYEDGRTFTGTYDWDGTRKEGTLKSANGEVLFKGSFTILGKYDTGYGKETGTYSDGTRWEFEGNYINGRWNGRGVEIWPNQEVGYLKRYDGNFEEGERSGYGIGEYEETREGWILKYDGNWKNNNRNGYGVAEYNESRVGYMLVYKGYWKDGYRSGEGTAYYTNKTWCRAIWKKGNVEKEIDRGTWN